MTMYQENMMSVMAKTMPEGLEAKGGVCKFIKPVVLQEQDKDNEKELFMMLHPDFEGKPMVSRVDPKTIMPVWSCWDWMDSWLMSYEKSNPEKFSLIHFKQWINSQPMTSG